MVDDPLYPSVTGNSQQSTPSTASHAPDARLPDPQYVERVTGHISRVERSEIATRQDIGRTKEELDRTVQDLRLEVEALQGEVHAIEAATAQVVERVKSTVAQFKTVVKKGDLARLQSRTDMWSPETRITREQFKILLEKELGNAKGNP